MRKRELDFCCLQNLGNPNIDRIYFLLEKDEDRQPWMEVEKVTVVALNKRASFREVIEFANSKDSRDIHIIANLDIFFDDSIAELKGRNLDGVFIALTRWNLDAVNGVSALFNVNCSQDSWMWRGKVDLKLLDLHYKIGEVGCDNAICGEFYEAGWKVINPAFDIKSHHVHRETERNYVDADVVRKKLYVLPPSKQWEVSSIEFWKDCSNGIV